VHPTGWFEHLVLAVAALKQVGRTLSLFLSLATLFFTVLAAMAFGIAASYVAVTSILFAFGHHSRAHDQAALVESPASGD
jgi:Na+-transporting NADH:ubiquinone oxidoreductase subunit NqrE